MKAQLQVQTTELKEPSNAGSLESLGATDSHTLNVVLRCGASALHLPLSVTQIF